MDRCFSMKEIHPLLTKNLYYIPYSFWYYKESFYYYFKKLKYKFINSISTFFRNVSLTRLT